MTPVITVERCNGRFDQEQGPPCQLHRGHDGPCDWEGGREVVGRPRLVKLVRDHMGDLLPDSTVHYAPVEDRELAVEHLRKKLVEEAVEYVLDPSIGELGDVLAVVRTLAHIDLGDGMAAVEDEAQRKLRERGPFDGLVGMWVTTSADPFDEKGGTRK